jgi:hypothetical protein
MLGNLIGGFIVIILGVTLAGPVASIVKGTYENATGGNSGLNITGTSATVISLTTLFYCLAVATAGIGIATAGLKNSGLM